MLFVLKIEWADDREKDVNSLLWVQIHDYNLVADSIKDENIDYSYKPSSIRSSDINSGL